MVVKNFQSVLGGWGGAGFVPVAEGKFSNAIYYFFWGLKNTFIITNLNFFASKANKFYLNYMLQFKINDFFVKIFQ